MFKKPNVDQLQLKRRRTTTADELLQLRHLLIGLFIAGSYQAAGFGLDVQRRGRWKIGD